MHNFFSINYKGMLQENNDLLNSKFSSVHYFLRLQLLHKNVCQVYIAKTKN